MSFTHRNKNNNGEGPTPAPAEVYECEITEATDLNKEGLPLTSSKSGHPMVKCKLKIHDGDRMWPAFWHWVVFIPEGNPGDGMSIQFLKRIGEPWQGEYEVTPANWVGKRFRAKLKTERDNQGTLRNSIGWIVDESAKAPDADEVPW